MEREFNSRFEECTKISNEFVELARNMKSKFDKDYGLEPRVFSFYNICKIFFENRLIENKKLHDKVSKKEAGKNWFEKLDELIKSTNKNCDRIKKIAISMNKEQLDLIETVNKLTNMRLKASRETLLYKWVAQTLKDLKISVDLHEKRLSDNVVEKGFEEMT